MSDNVLLQLNDEPRFDAIEVAQIEPAMQQAMTEARTAIAAVKGQTDITWGNTVTRLTDITQQRCDVLRSDPQRIGCIPKRVSAGADRISGLFQYDVADER